MLLAVYLGCDTAVTDADFGNVTDQTVTQGANAAVGFKTGTFCVFNEPASGHRWWMTYLWMALAQGIDQDGSPRAVRQSVDWATQEVKDRFDSFFGTESNYIAGDDTLKIVPVR